MTEICKESATDSVAQAKVTDFINYVFSFDHRPHDFKTLIPKGFADGIRNPDLIHYTVKENGEIKALIDLLHAKIAVGDEVLSVGLIGNVSVHPYSRGCGYMRELMERVIADAEAEKIDLLALGGQRQRYGYWGFEKAGVGVRFDLNGANIRHALGGVDASHFSLRPIKKGDDKVLDLAFDLNEAKPLHTKRPHDIIFEILHTWNENADVICKDGTPCGILVGKIHELSLLDTEDLPAALKAAYTYLGADRLSLTLPAYDKAGIAALSPICENETIVTSEQIKILNYKNTVAAFLDLQAKIKPLCDTELHFAIENAFLNVSVKDGAPTVTEEKIDGKSYTGMGETAAVAYFFGLNGLLRQDPEAKDLFPLPLWLSPTDLF